MEEHQWGSLKTEPQLVEEEEKWFIQRVCVSVLCVSISVCEYILVLINMHTYNLHFHV